MLALLAALTLFTFGQLARSRFDPSAFIVAGDQFTHPADVPFGVAVLEHSAGYDGQFYYRLSLDPFTSKSTDFGVTLDRPSYRHQRILYPLIVHLVSLPDPRFVPVAMILTNFVFFALLAWISGRLAQSLNRHALWGMLIVAYPGFLITYSRDLVEIVEATFLTGTVLLLRLGKPVQATACLTLAVWSRETSLLVAVAAAIVFALDRLQGRTDRHFGAYFFVVPMIGFCVLQAALYVNWGQFPVLVGSAVLSQGPLAGFTSSLSRSAFSLAWVHQFFALAFIVLSSSCILYHLFVTRVERTEKLACLGYGLLMASVGGAVWAEDIAFLRVFTQFYLFGAVAVLATRLNPLGVVLALLVGTTLTFEFVRLGSAGPIAQLIRNHLT